jgi:hypothetical protein
MGDGPIKLSIGLSTPGKYRQHEEAKQSPIAVLAAPTGVSDDAARPANTPYEVEPDKTIGRLLVEKTVALTGEAANILLENIIIARIINTRIIHQQQKK